MHFTKKKKKKRSRRKKKVFELAAKRTLKPFQNIKNMCGNNSFFI